MDESSSETKKLIQNNVLLSRLKDVADKIVILLFLIWLSTLVMIVIMLKG